jgi:formate hydrogenlyase transcriptional activator
MRGAQEHRWLERVEGESFHSPVLALQRRISACTDLDQILDAFAADLGALLPVDDRVSLAFLEPDGEWMRVYRLIPRAEPAETLPRVRVEGTPVGRVVREGAGRVVADVWADRNITFGHAARDRIRSTISVPMRIGGRVVGVLNAGSCIPGACSESMLAPLEDMAVALGAAFYAAEAAFRGLDTQAVPARQPQGGDGDALGLVGDSPAFRSLVTVARRAARSDAELLITGETGVGKTALARAMHKMSGRAEGPFVTVHLGDLSPTLVESELFGHERGAFTGATTSRPGRFERAGGGTIFLDEIGETPLPLQAKLLRIIQDRCFERVGGDRTIHVDLRIIAATSRDLRAMVARGEFRQDLFYRLDVVPLHVPPLRERRPDIVPLAEAVLARLGEKSGRRFTLSPSARDRLCAYAWPGNVRELESVLRRATILEDRDELELSGVGEVAPPEPEAPPCWPTLEEHQRHYIQQVLERTSWVIEGPSGAAALLGMNPSTLRSRLKRLGLLSRSTGETT